MPITFCRVTCGGNVDNRRAISDIVMPDGVPFPIIQIKTVTLTKEAVELRLAVGNHYHTKESGREEFFVVVGPKDVPLVTIRYRDEPKGEMKDRYMFLGEACYIPPECSHAFVAMNPGVVLWGFSNLPYDSLHDVPDKLF